MPVISLLPSLLRDLGVENAHQFRLQTGVGQGTAIRAMDDPSWIPNPTVLEVICEIFDIQPGDFLVYQKANHSESPIMSDNPIQSNSKLEELRAKAKMSQEELANRSGIPLRTYQRWISHGNARPTIPQLKGLCKTLGVSIFDLPDDFGPT